MVSSAHLVAVAAVSMTLLASACSSTSPTSAPSVSPTSSSTSTSAADTPVSSAASNDSVEPGAQSPSATLDPIACGDFVSAEANLATASDAGAARKAADTLEKYNPPANVAHAIEHFVTTVGIQSNDPDYDANNTALTTWVKQLCPS